MLTNALEARGVLLAQKRLEASRSINNRVGAVGRRPTEILEGYPVADLKGLVTGSAEDWMGILPDCTIYPPLEVGPDSNLGKFEASRPEKTE